MGNALMQLCPACHRVDEHAWFRLKGQADLSLLGVFAQLAASIDQTIHQCLLARRLRHRARPEADCLSVESCGNVYSPAEKIETAFAPLGVGAEQGRLMFAPGIQ